MIFGFNIYLIIQSAKGRFSNEYNLHFLIFAVVLNLTKKGPF